MKLGIHPPYHRVVFQDSTTGEQLLTRSTAGAEPTAKTVLWSDGNTYPLISVDVTSGSHPFWTGTQRVMDTAGQVDKFHRRYGKRTR